MRPADRRICRSYHIANRMALDKFIISAAGVVVTVFIWWFFLKKKNREVAVFDSVDIIVNGGYSPEVISLQKGKLVKLVFFRKDPSSCLEEVVFGDFHIRKHLPLNQKTTIEITPQKSGEFGYSCGMGMFHGKIIVK